MPQFLKEAWLRSQEFDLKSQQSGKNPRRQYTALFGIFFALIFLL